MAFRLWGAWQPGLPSIRWDLSQGAAQLREVGVTWPRGGSVKCLGFTWASREGLEMALEAQPLQGGSALEVVGRVRGWDKNFYTYFVIFLWLAFSL